MTTSSTPETTAEAASIPQAPASTPKGTITTITPIVENHGEWLAQRRRGLGGSDIAAIVGISPFRKAIDVYLDKKGLAPHLNETPSMHWGHRLEGVIADEYAALTGYRVEPGVHLERGCMVGNTDRMVPDAGRILEVKTASPFAAKDWGIAGTDAIPDYYLTQVQWYLGLLSADEYVGADIPVLIGGNDFRVYHVERNDELIAELQAIGQEWWARFIEGNETPAPDGSLEDMQSRLTLHPKDNGEILSSTGELDALAMKLEKAKAQLSEAEKHVEELELKLKNVIGDASGIEGTLWSATWKAPRASNVTDWKAVCQAASVPAELIRQFTKEKKASRRFLFKSRFETPEASPAGGLFQ
jgi:putative phage-type endonuclease